MATRLELEAEKMRRVPGIIFVDAPTGGRVARVVGTGLEVFEIILSYRAVGEDRDRLKQCFDWLSDDQLHASVTYYETYPDEINAELKDNTRYTPEYVYAKFPFTRPQSR